MILTNLGIEFEPEEEKVRYTVDDDPSAPFEDGWRVLDWGRDYETSGMDAEDTVQTICHCGNRANADQIAFALNLFTKARKAADREVAGL